MKYDGVIVVLNYNRNSIDLIKYNQVSLDNKTFDEYLENLGYDIIEINYFVTDEVAIRQYKTDGNTLIKGTVNYY